MEFELVMQKTKNKPLSDNLLFKLDAQISHDTLLTKPVTVNEVAPFNKSIITQFNLNIELTFNDLNLHTQFIENLILSKVKVMVVKIFSESKQAIELSTYFGNKINLLI
jgi:hypothetical protein